MKLTRILLEALLEVYAKGLSTEYFIGVNHSINRDPEVKRQAKEAYDAVRENYSITSKVKEIVEPLYILVAQKFIKEVQTSLQFKNFPEDIEYIYKVDPDYEKQDITVSYTKYMYAKVVARDEDSNIYAEIYMELKGPERRRNSPVVYINDQKTLISYNINSGTEYSQDFRDLWDKGISRYRISYSKEDTSSRTGGFRRFYNTSANVAVKQSIADAITSFVINTAIDDTNSLADRSDKFEDPVKQFILTIRNLLADKQILTNKEAKEGATNVTVDEDKPETDDKGTTRIPATGSWTSGNIKIEVDTKILKNSKKLSKKTTLVKISGVEVYRGDDLKK